MTARQVTFVAAHDRLIAGDAARDAAAIAHREAVDELRRSRHAMPTRQQDAVNRAMGVKPDAPDGAAPTTESGSPA